MKSEKETQLLFEDVGFNTFPIGNWYLLKYGTIANMFRSNSYVRLDSFLEKNEKKILYKSSYNSTNSNSNGLSRAIIDLDSKGTIAYVIDCYFDTEENCHKAQLDIFYKEETVALQNAIKYIKKNRVEDDKKGIINLICKTQSGFSLKEYTIKCPNIDFDSNYNNDFKDIDKIILTRFREKDEKGLVLLYGHPGTGKTSYIRHVINNVDKRVLYMPPDMASELSNPGLIPFLASIPNSILIVEDAENVLIKRQGQHNQAISNILNLSDGLLSDCLKIQILATFNTDLSNIDEALLRKGRLIAKYEFKELSKDRVQRLSRKLGIKFNKDCGTLAEIYNCSDVDFVKGTKKTIGFKVQEDGILDKPVKEPSNETPKN